MRKLYSLAMYLGMPLILTHLALRGLRDRAYLQRWPERFGRFPAPRNKGGIAVHAASVGEINAAAPLIRALLGLYPGNEFVLTTFTPTGSARARALFADRVFHVYIPIDLPGAVRRFFARIQPRLLIVMETEIWPNLFAGATAGHIPILLANARLSERSARGYRRWKSLVLETLQRVTVTSAQSSMDAERFIACGASPSRVEITGNLKFDIRLPDSLREQARALRDRWGKDRPVLIAASTHQEEDAIVIDAFQALLEEHPEALLILVPRHPERFAIAAETARLASLRVELHSQGDACSPRAQCFVIDAMGELMRYYACCDVAFVGGSFAKIGGHNVLEPAALARPVVVGPHTFNFEDITRSMIEQGAALQVHSVSEFKENLLDLFGDPDRRKQMGQAGRELVQSGSGALDNTLAVIGRLLETRA